jgi:ABC-type transport system involved in multi-copper enzyme maturation permease subunit
MPIYDLTYRGWKGARTRVPAWYPILENTIRLAFRNRLLSTMYRLCLAPPLIACVVLYIRYSFEREMGPRGNPLMSRFAFNMPHYLNFLVAQGIIAIAVAGIVGSQSIAADRRGNAMESLFSRAITRYDYLLGRFLGLFLLVLGGTLIPGFMIWVADYAFSTDPERLVKILDYPVRISAWALLLSASASLLILAFSAMIKRGWLALAAFAAFLLLGFFVTTTAAVHIARASESAAGVIRAFSYFDALYAIQGWIFGVPVAVSRIFTSVPVSLFFIGGLAFVSLMVILRRVRPIEVVS